MKLVVKVKLEGSNKKGRTVRRSVLSSREYNGTALSVMNTWRRKSIYFPFGNTYLTESRTFCALCFNLLLAFDFGCPFLVLDLVEVDQLS